MDITVSQKKYVIGNIYAPTSDSPGEQDTFMDSVEKLSVISISSTSYLGVISTQHLTQIWTGNRQASPGLIGNNQVGACEP